MRTKTNELVTLLDITPEQYAVREDEQHLYHFLLKPCKIHLQNHLDNFCNQVNFVLSKASEVLSWEDFFSKHVISPMDLNPRI